MADLAPYIDLSLDDRDPDDILDAALALAADRLPGWTPREGNVEVALLEVLALVASEMVFALNRLPNVVVEALLKLYGIEHLNGTKLGFDVRVTVSDDLGRVVPAGTTIGLAEGESVRTFTTDADLVFPPGGATTLPVHVTADAVGGSNLLPLEDGTPFDVIDAVPFVDTVEADGTIFAFVINPESDTEYFSRAMARLSRLTDTIVLPDHFAAAASEELDVDRAKTTDLTDPGTAGVGDDPGHVTVSVIGPGGAALSEPRRTAIAASLLARTIASLQIHVINAEIVVVPVTVQVRRFAGFTDAQVIESVTAVLTAYLSTAFWDWNSDVVSHNELIARIDTAVGVDVVLDLSAPAADVPLAGFAPLAVLGALAIDVVAP